MSKRIVSILCLLCPLGLLEADQVGGWLHWRGPHQNGTSDETGLPGQIELGGENHLWSYPLMGRGQAVIAGDRVYAFGYAGKGPDLREYLVALDADSGREIWKLGFNDFLSDIVYERYAIGAPSVDSETGNIYLMTTAGEMVCVDPSGRILWRHSMMERFGLLTFPNGRRGAAVIEGGLVIHHAITSYWGAQGPARDRFYAFDKLTGDLVWSATPGTPPKDSSFSSPVVADSGGRRVLYCGTGCGNLVAIDARTGDNLWRYHFSYGGVNASVLLHGGDKLIAIHGKENLDSSEVGRMAAIRIGARPGEGGEPLVLDRSYELWRQPLVMFTSSPALAGDRVYQVTHTGELECLDAGTGRILWSHKLENGQLHASPLHADGKLYVPMANGNFYILKVEDDGVEVLDKVEMDAGLLGAPTAWNGRIYLHSQKALHCFGRAGGRMEGRPWQRHMTPPDSGEDPVRLQPVPNDVLLRPGQSQRLRVRSLDDRGRVVSGSVRSARFEKYVPPTARVRAEIDARFRGRSLRAARDAEPSAGAFRATRAELSGVGRGRVLFGERFSEDFEGFSVTESYPEGHVHHGTAFAYPPLPWIGARFKWDIREMEGNKVLAKTLDRVLFQRATTFFGSPDMSDYTMEADVMTDGNRRMKSNVGLIHQRYVIELVGNWQRLEVSSNHERIKQSVPFRWDTGAWYRLKTRVDVAGDGSGVVRAKAWKRGEEEPAAWTIEVPHRVAHDRGAPGIRGFSPQSRYSVYVDNISVYPN